MKKINKIFGILVGIILLSGCMNIGMSPSNKVEGMFEKYIYLDKEIENELDKYIDKQEITKEQKEKYKEVVKKEYKTIKYDIKNEKIDGESAMVEVEITVKDLYKPSMQAEKYLVDNPTEFYTDGVYDSKKFIDYKLDKMDKSMDTVTYTIYINLLEKDKNWSIQDLDNTTLEKIHGIYNYEANQK